ncbi:MAG: hypothetical protein DRP42_06235 [Tenericutes bacterium]|nr:MAG: hypothetical protein DRP42_06235 [Mycoplasmatota bacterium]
MFISGALIRWSVLFVGQLLQWFAMATDIGLFLRSNRAFVHGEFIAKNAMDGADAEEHPAYI